MKISRHLISMVLAGLVGSASPLEAQTDTASSWAAEDEVFYHIFVRSFRDSNGDQIGDLEGIRSRLPYLQDLGVTSLLLTPVNPSPFYHNYFGSSFEGVDPAYGDSGALTRLVRTVHQRKMKIYLDQEIQYVAQGHAWWRESEGQPHSRYGRYVLYNDSGNTQPESAVFGLSVFPMWNGERVGLTLVNLHEPAVRDYFAELFLSLMDPNRDGNFEDGVDGFRIDHMMDDLDNKGKLTNLFARFWAPIFARARAANPAVRILAEQYDWGYGDDFLKRGGADLVFAFPIRGAIVGLKAPALGEAITQTLVRTPAGKGQIVFIENHDTDRFASVVGADRRKERLGAALNILLKGTPLLYYGQEIGMKGKQFKEWGTDANDIPVREAFEWNRRGDEGLATWYRGDYPWWTGRYARDDDSISVEEQSGDPRSLLSQYRRLIALRRGRPELSQGDEEVLATKREDVLAVLRTSGDHVSLLLANLGAETFCVPLPRKELPTIFSRSDLRDLLAERQERKIHYDSCVRMEPFAVRLLVQ